MRKQRNLHPAIELAYFVPAAAVSMLQLREMTTKKRRRRERNPQSLTEFRQSQRESQALNNHLQELYGNGFDSILVVRNHPYHVIAVQHPGDFDVKRVRGGNVLIALKGSPFTKTANPAPMEWDDEWDADLEAAAKEGDKWLRGELGRGRIKPFRVSWFAPRAQRRVYFPEPVPAHTGAAAIKQVKASIGASDRKLRKLGQTPVNFHAEQMPMEHLNPTGNAKFRDLSIGEWFGFSFDSSGPYIKTTNRAYRDPRSDDLEIEYTRIYGKGKVYNIRDHKVGSINADVFRTDAPLDYTPHSAAHKKYLKQIARLVAKSPQKYLSQFEVEQALGKANPANPVQTDQQWAAIVQQMFTASESDAAVMSFLLERGLKPARVKRILKLCGREWPDNVVIENSSRTRPGRAKTLKDWYVVADEDNRFLGIVSAATKTEAMNKGSVYAVGHKHLYGHTPMYRVTTKGPASRYNPEPDHGWYLYAQVPPDKKFSKFWYADLEDAKKFAAQVIKDGGKSFITAVKKEKKNPLTGPRDELFATTEQARKYVQQYVKDHNIDAGKWVSASSISRGKLLITFAKRKFTVTADGVIDEFVPPRCTSCGNKLYYGEVKRGTGRCNNCESRKSNPGAPPYTLRDRGDQTVSEHWNMKDATAAAKELANQINWPVWIYKTNKRGYMFPHKQIFPKKQRRNNPAPADNKFYCVQWYKWPNTKPVGSKYFTRAEYGNALQFADKKADAAAMVALFQRDGARWVLLTGEIPPGAKRQPEQNPGAPESINALAQMFHGRVTGATLDVPVSEHHKHNKHIQRIGRLPYIKMHNRPHGPKHDSPRHACNACAIFFPRRTSWVSMNGNKRIILAGSGVHNAGQRLYKMASSENPGINGGEINLGRIEVMAYVTPEKHSNSGTPILYYHPHAEETGRVRDMPSLHIDRNGMLYIPERSGRYDIDERGIIN